MGTEFFNETEVTLCLSRMPNDAVDHADLVRDGDLPLTAQGLTSRLAKIRCPTGQ